jgi:hypothetical protein
MSRDRCQLCLRTRHCREHQSCHNRTSTKKITVGVRCVVAHAGLEVFGEQGGPRLAQGGSGDVGPVSFAV